MSASAEYVVTTPMAYWVTNWHEAFKEWLVWHALRCQHEEDIKTSHLMDKTNTHNIH